MRGKLLGHQDSSSTPFVQGAVVGVLAMLLIWGFSYAVGSREPVPRQAEVASRGGTVRSEATKVATVEKARVDPLDRCRRVFAAQAGPLRAAAASLNQWEVHVGAMNKLVTGQLSSQQATSFWNRTRVGARQRLARYDGAMRTIRSLDVRCPKLSTASVSAGVLACRHAVTARNRELGAAAVAIATWRRHVLDMDMFRNGSMSAAQASRMWLRNWQKGVAQLDSYRAVRRRAASSSC